MKKYILRLIAVLIFASATITSCSVEYRESHRHHYDNNGDRHDRDNHDNHDHDYRDYH